MCNIAGYVGAEPAAPLLLDLIERQEGLAGGYYTGIATIHEGNMHWRKVVGDCERLREETDAEDLPGSIGLAHSRSNSGGDWRWSHPFIACNDSVAYIANGSRGYYEDRLNTTEAAQALEEQGHIYTAVADQQVGKYPSLSGGRSVHMSDVMAHAIGAELAGGREPEDAIRQAFLDLPAEIVGLYITPDHPEAIFGARYTMPMCVTFDARGAFIASSPTGFDPRPDWWTWVPPFSSVTVRASRLEVSRFDCPEGPLPDDISRADARTGVLEALSDGEGRFVGPLLDAVKHYSSRDELIVRYDPIYEVLYELLHEGCLTQQEERLPGAKEGITAPKFRFFSRFDS